MKLKLHQNQKEAVFYSLPGLVARALGFLLLPIYSRVLLPSEFGIVSVALVVSGVLQMIVLPGFEGLYLRYGFQGYSEANTQPSRVIGTIVRAHLLLVFVVLPLFGFIAVSVSRKLSPDVPSSFIWLAIATLSIESLQAPLVARFKAFREVGKLALFELLQVLLNTSVILTFLFRFHLGPLSLLGGTFLGAILLMPIALVEIVKNLRFAPWLNEAAKIVGKSFLVLGPEVFFYWGLTAVDRYTLNYFRGPEQTGIYVAGYQVGSLVVSLLIIGSRHWKMLIYQTYVDQQYVRAGMRTLYRETFILFLILASFLAIIAKPFTLTVLGAKFARSQDIIPIVMAVVALRVPMAFFSMYCWAKQTRRVAVKLNALGCVIFACALGILVPIFGMKGAAWSGFLACLPFSLALHFLDIEEFKFDSQFLRPRTLMAAIAIIMAILGELPLGLSLSISVVLIWNLLNQARTYFSALAELKRV